MCLPGWCDRQWTLTAVSVGNPLVHFHMETTFLVVNPFPQKIHSKGFCGFEHAAATCYGVDLGRYGLGNIKRGEKQIVLNNNILLERECIGAYMRKLSRNRKSYPQTSCLLCLATFYCMEYNHSSIRTLRERTEGHDSTCTFTWNLCTKDEKTAGIFSN